MHEMSLAERVLQIIEEHATSQNFSCVKTVWLEIGALSHADPDAIRFCFDAVTKNSLAEGAALEIVRTPGRARCDACAKVVAVTTLLDPCPDCGGHDLRITDGDALRVRELEVD